MKNPLLLLSNDGKIIEKVHKWLDPTFEIVTGFSIHKVESIYDLIKKINPRILILDISPSNSFSYQLLEKLNDRYFELIVISDTSEDVLEGISFGVSSFLLKPLTEVKLKKALEKAYLKLKDDRTSQSLKKNNEEVEKGEEISNIVSLPLLKGRSLELKTENIIRFESNGTMTQVYLKNSSREFTMINCPIKQCGVIVGNQDFFRIHREHLVNLNYIKPFSGLDTSKKSITLITGITLPIARRRYLEFVSQYDEFIKRIEV